MPLGLCGEFYPEEDGITRNYFTSEFYIVNFKEIC